MSVGPPFRLSRSGDESHYDFARRVPSGVSLSGAADNYCRRALLSTGIPTQARAVQQDDADVPEKLQLTYSFRISQSPSWLTTFRPEREKILRSDKFRPRYDEKIARVHVFMRA